MFTTVKFRDSVSVVRTKCFNIKTTSLFAIIGLEVLADMLVVLRTLNKKLNTIKTNMPSVFGVSLIEIDFPIHSPFSFFHTVSLPLIPMLVTNCRNKAKKQCTVKYCFQTTCLPTLQQSGLSPLRVVV